MAPPVKFTRLRISGFKSFADPSELELADGLTGIVGPNGCGKSNIVEALRWVMGESSARGLRGAEMEDVIFAGSATRPPFDFAEVTLTIEGPVPEVAAPGEQIEVVRRISRGSGSSFRLRGREVRARDVQIMLADAATGARSAAIVGQGEIARLVEVRPDERRRLLEEAAGIGGLHARRREAELRLEAAARNLERVEQRLGQLQAQRERLARQAREAERFRKLQAELRRLEGLRLLKRYQQAAAALDAARAELAAIEAGLWQRAGERAEWRARAAALEQERRELERQRQQTARELARVDERIAMAARLAEDLRRSREETEARLNALARTLAQERAALAQAQQRLSAIAEDMNALAAQRPSLTAQRASVHDAVAQAEAELAQREAVLAELVREQLQVEASLEAARTRLRELDEQQATWRQSAALRALEHLDAEAGRLRVKVAQLGEQLSAIDAALTNLEAERARYQANREQNAADRAAAEAAWRAAVEERRALEQRLRERRSAMEAIEEKRRLLERQLERLAERAIRLERSREALSIDSIEQRLAAAIERHDALAAQSEQLRSKLSIAEREVAESGEAMRGAGLRLRELEAAMAALESEIGALSRLLPPTPADALLHRLQVPEDRARAIAALLGDDLLLGTDPAAQSFWREDLPATAVAADPGPPPGCEPLAAGLDLPPALLRVLAGAGFVHNGEAERLQPQLRAGQSLVSRDGGLWRWDGLVRRPGATVEAARRLAIERELAAKREALAAARRRLSEDEPRFQDLRRRHEQARAAVDSLTREWRQHEAALTQQAAVIARLEQELASARERAAALAVELTELEREREDVRAARAELEAQLATLLREGDPAPALDLARAAERRTEEERRRHESLLADLDRRLRDVEGRLVRGREERSRVEQALASAREQLLQAEQRLAESVAERRRQEAELARLKDEALAAAARVAELEATCDSVKKRVRESGAARDAARSRLTELQRQLAQLNEQERKLESDLARLAVEREHVERAAAEAARRLDEAEQAESEVQATLERLRATAETPACADAEPRLRDALARTLADLESALAALEGEQQRCTKAIAELETEIGRERERAALLRAECARVGEQLSGLAQAIEERAGEPVARVLAEGGEELAAELRDLDAAALEERIAHLVRARERLGPVNLRAAQELADIERELEQGRAEAEDLKTAIERLRRAISRLDREGRERLLAAFAEVDRHFRALFERLFGGGRAELRLTDLDDPFAAGLELDAMPPGKRLQHVSLLSGGEKSLAGLALIFAFFLARPSPLCVLDEVDAALDDANVERFVDVMEEIARSTGTRFLVVTHHPLTMARMDRLYGVTMAERGVSRLVSVALDRAVELRATA